MTDSPLWQLTLTRMRMFFREPGAVFWAFGFPILLSVGLGAAFRNRPPEPADVAVQAGPGAQELAAALAKSPDLKVAVLTAAEANQQLRVAKVQVVVQPGPRPTFVYDSTSPKGRLARLLANDAIQRAAGRPDPVATAVVERAEPGSRYIDFLVPGLLGMNIMSSSMWGIGYVIVETRTKKLLKRMLATPMRRWQFLLSFLLMRIVFLAVELPLLLGFAYFAFDCSVHGSLALLVAVSLAGAACFGGVGLLVASRAQNTQTVGGLMNLVMMPMFIASGVFFNSSHFPDAVQPLIQALPLTALNDALRAVMNEGAGAAQVGGHLAALAVGGMLAFAAGLRWFRWG